MTARDIPAGVLSRAQGCLLGQIVGDSLGSLVEFKDASTIQALHPDCVRELADGGVWNTIAGQPTDDSEMALALARSLVRNQGFSIDDIRASYVRWYRSGPFDIGNTTASGLGGKSILESQANGTLMRVSPLGIFGWRMKPEALAKLAAEDASLTQPDTSGTSTRGRDISRCTLCSSRAGAARAEVRPSVPCGTKSRKTYVEPRHPTRTARLDPNAVHTCSESKAALPSSDFLEGPLEIFRRSLSDCLNPNDEGRKTGAVFRDALWRGECVRTSAPTWTRLRHLRFAPPSSGFRPYRLYRDACRR